MLEAKVLGNAIKDARIKNNLSQEELAELVGITPTHLKHIESEHRKPSIEVLFNRTKILHISLDNLIFNNDSKSAELHNAEILLKDCDLRELEIVIDVIKSIQKHRAVIDIL